MHRVVWHTGGLPMPHRVGGASYRLDRNPMTIEMRSPQEKTDSTPIARIAILGASRSSASVVGPDRPPEQGVIKASHFAS